MARLMRWLICTVVVLAFAPSAFADDFVLRGAQPAFHWGGLYGGGQIGYSSSTMNFSTGAGPASVERYFWMRSRRVSGT